MNSGTGAWCNTTQAIGFLDRIGMSALMLIEFCLLPLIVIFCNLLSVRADQTQHIRIFLTAFLDEWNVNTLLAQGHHSLWEYWSVGHLYSHMGHITWASRPKDQPSSFWSAQRRHAVPGLSWEVEAELIDTVLCDFCMYLDLQNMHTAHKNPRHFSEAVYLYQKKSHGSVEPESF